jgi:hypothetical protein
MPKDDPMLSRFSNCILLLYLWEQEYLKSIGVGLNVLLHFEDHVTQ